MAYSCGDDRRYQAAGLVAGRRSIKSIPIMSQPRIPTIIGKIGRICGRNTRNVALSVNDSSQCRICLASSHSGVMVMADQTGPAPASIG